MIGKQHRISQVKDKQARQELSLAHAMVGLLSLLSILLLLTLNKEVELSTALLTVVVVLLAAVALFSLCIAWTMRKPARK